MPDYNVLAVHENGKRDHKVMRQRQLLFRIDCVGVSGIDGAAIDTAIANNGVFIVRADQTSNTGGLVRLEVRPLAQTQTLRQYFAALLRMVTIYVSRR